MSTISLTRAISNWRFTLSELLLFMLSISVGLARWRVPGATFDQSLLGCFTAWFIVGMVQRSREAWRLRRETSLPTASFKFGFAVAVAGPVLVALLLVVALLTDAAIRVDWFNLGRDLGSDAECDKWIARKLNDTLIGLAIVCGYWNRAVSGDTSDRSFRVSWLWNVAIAAAGLMLLIMMLMSTAAVFNMVYTALAGVIDFQPTRWAGVEFTPAGILPAPVERAFAIGGIAAGTALLAAAASSILLARFWPKGVVVRIVLALAAASSLALAVWLLWWCAAFAFPVLSPLLAAGMWEQPRTDLLLALLLMLSFATAAAWWITRSDTDTIAARRRDGDGSKAPPHLNGSVALLGIAALLSVSVMNWWSRDVYWLWYRYADISYNQIEPEHLMCLAAVLVLAAAVRRARRGLPPDAVTIRAVEPARFALVWLLVVGALLLVPPVGAWFGLGLTLLPAMP